MARPCCAAEARFIDPATISVDGRAITARRFVIAAGSRAAVPPIEGLDLVPYWTNDSLFDLSERPDHLLILGGGPIGLEMADAFSGLGCRVTVVEAGRIAAKDDPELVDGLRQALAARGVIFREGAKVTAVTPGPVLVIERRHDGSRARICSWQSDGRPIWQRSTWRPETSRRGRPGSRPTGVCAASPTRRVFAAGDIADPAGIGPRAFTHVGIVPRRHHHPPRAVPAAGAGSITRRCLGSPIPIPELAQTGLTEAEAVAARV